jgi:hypothetical protein
MSVLETQVRSRLAQAPVQEKRLSATPSKPALRAGTMISLLNFFSFISTGAPVRFEAPVLRSALDRLGLARLNKGF